MAGPRDRQEPDDDAADRHPDDRPGDQPGGPVLDGPEPAESAPGAGGLPPAGY